MGNPLVHPILPKNLLLIHRLLLHYQLIYLVWLQQHIKTLLNGVSHVNQLVTLFWWHTSNWPTCLSQSLSFGPWIIDSSATDHICSDCSLFSSFTSVVNLAFIIVVDDSQKQACGIGTTKLLSSISVDFVFMSLTTFLIYCPSLDWSNLMIFFSLSQKLILFVGPTIEQEDWC